MDALALEGVEIHRHRRHQGFAFTGGHLGDLPLVQGDTAYELNVERNHVPLGVDSGNIPGGADMAAAGLFDDGEGLAHDIIEGLTVLQALAEFLGLADEFFLAETLEFFKMLIYLRHQRHGFFGIPGHVWCRISW